MTDRNLSATDVELLRVDAQVIPAVHDLDSECFVQLPQIDVFHSKARSLQELRDGENRAIAHFIRIATGDLKTAEHERMRDVQLVRALARHQQSGRRAI